MIVLLPKCYFKANLSVSFADSVNLAVGKFTAALPPSLLHKGA